MNTSAKWALLILLCMTGCAPTFTRTATSEAQTARDHFECQRQSIVVGISGEVVSYPMLTQCMRARGYR